MDYIKKLVKQRPFIYYINDEYYAFGVGVCTICDNILVKSRYDRLNAIDKNADTEQVVKIFKDLIGSATTARDTKGVSLDSKAEFEKIAFNKLELEELKKQIKRYVTLWKEYKLYEYIH